MSEIQARDGRRQPFLWCSLDAMAHLRSIAEGPELMKLRSVYVAFCELAARGMDGDHRGFSAKRDELPAAAGISDRRIGPYLNQLVECGLLEVEERVDAFGRSVPNVYRLVDAPTESGGDAASPLPPTPRHSHPRRRGVTASPPSRARPDGVEEEEELREGVSASAHGQVSEEGDHPDDREGAIAAVLDPLLGQRDTRMRASDRLQLRGVLKAAPDGVDVLAAAGRLAANYGPDGKAAQRPIGNIAALLAEELSRSSIARELTTSPRRRRGAGPVRSTAERHLRIHRGRPAGAEPPFAKLEEAWGDVRDELRSAVSDAMWNLWLEPLQLLGFVTTLIENAGDADAQPERVLLLGAGPETVAWVAGRYGRLITEVITALMGPHVSVELVAVQAAAAQRSTEEAA